MLVDSDNGAYVEFFRGQIPDEMLERLFELFWNDESIWTQKQGLPRFSAWFAQCRCKYAYGNTQWNPIAYSQEFDQFSRLILLSAGLDPGDYNSCNANLYANGCHAIGYHNDNETLFGYPGEDVDIISFSLGAPRIFRVITVEERKLVFQKCLRSGNILRMRGTTQTHYLHSVIKDESITDGRINFTWRRIRHHNCDD